jgi:Ca2+/Na+ antiporter
MMMTIFRDLGFFIAALIMYDVLLYKGVIYMYEAAALVSFVVLYIFVIFQMNRMWEKKIQARNDMVKSEKRLADADSEHKSLLGEETPLLNSASREMESLQASPSR